MPAGQYSDIALTTVQYHICMPWRYFDLCHKWATMNDYLQHYYIQDTVVYSTMGNALRLWVYVFTTTPPSVEPGDDLDGQHRSLSRIHYDTPSSEITKGSLSWSTTLCTHLWSADWDSHYHKRLRLTTPVWACKKLQYSTTSCVIILTQISHNCYQSTFNDREMHTLFQHH